jgi:hypothetical protein
MSTFNRSNWNKNSGIWSRLFPQQRLSLLGADQLFSVSFESYLRTISPSDGRHSPFYRTITSWGRNTAPLIGTKLGLCQGCDSLNMLTGPPFDFKQRIHFPNRGGLDIVTGDQA